jgi:hypothetical protein
MSEFENLTMKLRRTRDRQFSNQLIFKFSNSKEDQG